MVKHPPPQKSWVLKVRHRNFAGLKTFRKIYTLNLTKIINLDCPSLGAWSARELPYYYREWHVLAGTFLYETI